MQPRCTCGALLPEDARFCHKCGKPQFEEDLARLAAEQPEPQPGPPTPSTPLRPSARISFKNSRALWISILVAAGTLIALMASGLLLPPLFPLVLCAGGFVAARLYNSQNGQGLTPSDGARLGWMTGLWLFVVVAILCASAAISLSSAEGWEQAKSLWAQIPQASKLLSLSQHDFFMQLLLALPVFFLLVTILPGLGGMLGAKFPRKRSEWRNPS